MLEARRACFFVFFCSPNLSIVLMLRNVWCVPSRDPSLLGASFAAGAGAAKRIRVRNRNPARARGLAGVVEEGWAGPGGSTHAASSPNRASPGVGANGGVVAGVARARAHNAAPLTTDEINTGVLLAECTIVVAVAWCAFCCCCCCCLSCVGMAGWLVGWLACVHTRVCSARPAAQKHELRHAQVGLALVRRRS